MQSYSLPNGANYYAKNPTSAEVESGIVKSESIRAKIIRHFTTNPFSRISPSEFMAKYNLHNPIHAIRPRFTDLERDGIIETTGEQIEGMFGRREMRYKRTASAGEQIALSF